MTTNKIDEVAREVAPKAIDWEAGRRAFLRTCGVGAASAALLSTIATSEAQAAPATNIDNDILNFALNLEYLEAEFYLRAAFNRGLVAGDTTGTGRPGGVTGGRLVTFTNTNTRLYAEEIANDEEAHVKLLRAVLAGQRVARPAINLTTSFSAAAAAAGLIPPGGTFDAFANETNFLLAAYIFEDVGVTAYKGAATLITSSSVLDAAAGLLSVEAYHAGIIRTILFSQGLFSQAQSISNARDSLDGNDDRDQGIGTAAQANLVPTDAFGLTYNRTVPQVRNIVYLNTTGAPTASSFFPAGLNGAFGPA